MKAIIAASMFMALAGLGSVRAQISQQAELDPSLHVFRSLPYVTLSDTLPALVLDYDGIDLAWDDGPQEFSMWINSQAVSDLVTDPPELSFSGSLGGQPVWGYVEPLASDLYDVYYSFGTQMPLLYGVYNPSGTPTVVSKKKCDCSNGTDLGCVSNHCTDGLTCPNSENATCRWTTVSID